MSYPQDRQSIYKEVIRGAKQLWTDFTSGQVPRWNPSFDIKGVCLQCHCAMDPACGDQLCSQQCVLDYWEEFVAQFSGSGPQYCRYPGCTKQCYVENNGRTHDYCGRRHAREHQEMKDAARKQQKRGKKPKSQTGCFGARGSNGHRLGGGSDSPPVHHGHHAAGQQQHAFTNYPNQGPTTRGMTAGYSAWDDKTIYFYNRDEPYYEFTNFFMGAPINLDGVQWPTTEHYFQAQKFIGTPYVEVIRNVSRPREAFDLSRNPSVSPWRRSDWESVKMDIMRKALNAKFTQHNYLRKKLVDTGTKELVERSPYDSFWGDGGDGSGQNHLGKLLIELRSKLQCVSVPAPANDVQRDSANPPFKRQMSDHAVKTRGNTSTVCEIHSTSTAPQISSGVGGGLPAGLTRRPLRSESDPGTEGNQSGTKTEVPTDILVDVDSNDTESQSDKHRQMPTHVQHRSSSGQQPSGNRGGKVRGLAAGYESMQVDKPNEEEPMETDENRVTTV